MEADSGLALGAVDDVGGDVLDLGLVELSDEAGIAPFPFVTRSSTRAPPHRANGRGLKPGGTPMRSKTSPTRIRVRHARSCPTSGDNSAACKCRPAYEAAVYLARDHRQIRKSFPTLAAARAWRADSTTAVRKGAMRSPTATTLRETADVFLAGAKDGTIRNRSGDVFKPSVIRGYERALRDRILPDLGARRLGDVSRFDLQDLADRLLADGLDPSTIRNALMPLRAIYRRALIRGTVSVNPTHLLELPAVRGRRERTAMPEDMGRLLAVLPVADRALWATAYYAGLRLGELRALRFADLDLTACCRCCGSNARGIRRPG